MPKVRTWLLTLVVTMWVVAGTATCGGGGDTPNSGSRSNVDDDGNFTAACRFSPNNCGGQIGGNCDRNNDCLDGFCCTEDKNCGGGMCTLACDNDRDCPSFMACEHDICFFTCDRDDDCANGQSCEHGKTVCEWP